ncbi:MAG: CRISPR-associated endonuclease Cas3'', partial [Burkholderiaceae bacterium]|nr:CRISPR-associated endonuclease Cas3'' [Burkholderiaceae bacterium]
MSPNNRPIAHAPKTPGALPHDLEEHLQEVSKLARDFAQSFGPDWAALAGIWHDLGKYRPGFQRYLALSNNPDGHIEGRVSGREKTVSVQVPPTERTSASSGVIKMDVLGHQAGRANATDPALDGGV